MKKTIENEEFDTMLETSDWRFSASIVGLIKYLKYYDLKYEIEEDCILYNSKDIKEDKYLEFVEYYYGEEFHHKIVENLLKNENLNVEQIKLVNEKLKGNKVMQYTFKKVKFDGNNNEQILKIISENRNKLIKETFRGKSNMYANYANRNKLFSNDEEQCRLLGYYIDAPKKGKSISFSFNRDTFVGTDVKEFDFIPFGFYGDREAFFINDNCTIEKLEITNKIFNKKVKSDFGEKIKGIDSRKALFKGIIESSDFINRDIEIIYKHRDKDYFETLYMRKESIDILKKFNEKNINYSDFCFSYKVKDQYYINVQNEVTDSILNNIVLDELIETFLKEKNKEYIISQLIKVNLLIRGENGMNDRLKGAYASAKKVAEKLESNKLESYRQKLTSSIIFKDYDRVCQILLQLSNYSGIEFGFIYPLFDEFEENKDLAYTFINALTKKSENK